MESLPLKIFLREPATRLLLVSSSDPLPQTTEDSMVKAMESAFTHYMPVIVGPTPYFGIQPID
jgi:hypothetical protein